MNGRLYIIKNKENDKVYIGKTYRTLYQRWGEHLREYLKPRNERRDLYIAMQEIGVDKFYIEELGVYPQEILTEKEKEFIKKYNSFSNGYNCTLGGDGKLYFPYSDEEVIKKYKELKTVEKVAEYFKCDIHTIRTRLHNNNIKIKTGQEHRQKIVYIPELKRCIGNISDTARWLFTQNLTNTTNAELVRKNLSRVISGTRKSYLGLTFIIL